MIRTPRLILRPWQPSDLPTWAALNADPEVRRFWPNTLTRKESDAQAEWFQHHIEEHGFGFWAVEVAGGAPFVGFTGLLRIKPDSPFAPGVEIGWRLAREHWGKGYATEAAKASLADGFGRLDLSEVVAFAVLGNAASFRVMERIGMVWDADADFDVPGAKGGPLKRVAVYRIGRERWRAENKDRVWLQKGEL